MLKFIIFHGKNCPMLAHTAILIIRITSNKKLLEYCRDVGTRRVRACSKN